MPHGVVMYVYVILTNPRLPETHLKVLFRRMFILTRFSYPRLLHTQCKSLAPEYERLGESYASVSNVVIAQIDADKHKKLATKFKVQGFPTLKWVSMGKTFDEAEDVNVERSAEGLIKFVNEKTGLSVKLKGDAPSSVISVTTDTFKEITSEGSKAFIGFFAPWYVLHQKLHDFVIAPSALQLFCFVLGLTNLCHSGFYQLHFFIISDAGVVT